MYSSLLTTVVIKNTTAHCQFILAQVH